MIFSDQLPEAVGISRLRKESISVKPYPTIPPRRGTGLAKAQTSARTASQAVLCAFPYWARRQIANPGRLK